MDISRIFRDGCLMVAHIRFWSGSVQLVPQDLGFTDDKVDDRFANLGKKWLIPEKRIAEFRKLDGQARYLIAQNGLDFPIGNAIYVPKRRMEKVLKELNELHAKYLGLANKLVEDFPVLREEMRPIFVQAAEQAFFQQLPATTEFSIETQEADKIKFTADFLARIDSMYPSLATLRSRYDLTWDVFEISSPKSGVATEEWQKQIHDKIDGFMTDVVKSLREETLEVCNRIGRLLTDGKAIKTTTLSSLKNFIDRYRDLNFVGDATVETQLNALQKELLDIYPAEQLNEVPEVNKDFRARLVKIGELASQVTDINSVTGEYKRKIQWQNNDDEAPAAAAA